MPEDGRLPPPARADGARTSAIDPRRWWVLWTVVAAQFMFVVDAFIVNVAIPTIRADLGAGPAAIEAVVAIYLIAYAALVIIGGRLGDLHGVKPVFLSGLLGFTLASVWCGLARSSAELIVARLVQGAMAALMVPQGLAAIHVLFPDGQRARAFAVYGVALGCGGGAGFLLGGLLVTLDLGGLSWRLVFFVNAPLGLAIAALAWRLIPRAPRRRRRSLDVAGAALLFAGLLCLIGPLLFGRDLGWAPWLWIVTLLGVAAIAGFLWLERLIEARGGLPLVASALIADRRFLQGLGAAFCFFSANLSFYFVLTLFLQGALGETALEAGLALLPLALAFVLASRRGMARLPSPAGRGPIAGCFCQIAGLCALAALAALAPRPDMPLVALALAVFGYGQGLVMAPLSSIVLSTVRSRDAGSASGVYATAVQIANAVGVAAIGTLFFAVEEIQSGRAAFLAALAAVGAMIAASASLLAWRGASKGRLD